ncbi:MAG: excinuclease ABC subunit UvrC [Deltaproteobacteria bacterium]|nr:excinuclease ABC subunit UvrC [Deltaproteobacteria bacterium]
MAPVEPEKAGGTEEPPDSEKARDPEELEKSGDSNGTEGHGKAGEPGEHEGCLRNPQIPRLHKQALALPASPGVYLMLDAKAKVIYVGKAKILPRRVSSYFRATGLTPRIGLLVSRIRSFEFVVTNTEKEALILENSLIKKHKPRYNVLLRDDKTYPSLRLSVNEPFPRLEIVRRPARDGSVIYGPFPSAGALGQTLKMVSRLFPLRRCRRPDVKKVARPCLNFQLGLCCGPCRPDYTEEEYRSITDGVRLFFRGRREELLKGLKSEMKRKADAFDFEAAAVLRDRAYDLERTLERQLVASFGDRDLDAWALAREGGFTGGAVLNVRGGAVTGCQPLMADGAPAEEEAPEVLAALIAQYYGQKNAPPPEILVPLALPREEEGALAEYLQSLAGKAVKFLAPKRGDPAKLLEMAAENARVTLSERLARMAKTTGALAELKAKLYLDKIPRRLECFDLAHLQGEAAGAGMVVMEEGDFRKSQYRVFKIKEAKGGDDYEGMREVMRRRFRPGRDPAKWPPPDLLVLDGGLGQLSSALKAFQDLGVSRPPMCGITKDRLHRGPDRIFLPGRRNPADLKPGSAGLLILAKLRDEAHRFSRTYHHGMRSKAMAMSAFSGIKGLGPARLKSLLKLRPTLEDLSGASDSEMLKAAPIAPEALAEFRTRLSGLLSGSASVLAENSASGQRNGTDARSRQPDRTAGASGRRAAGAGGAFPPDSADSAGSAGGLGSATLCNSVASAGSVSSAVSDSSTGAGASDGSSGASSSLNSEGDGTFGAGKGVGEPEAATAMATGRAGNYAGAPAPSEALAPEDFEGLEGPPALNAEPDALEGNAPGENDTAGGDTPAERG